MRRAAAVGLSALRFGLAVAGVLLPVLGLRALLSALPAVASVFGALLTP